MPTIPPATEELPSSSVPCPSCGVPVALGYPRCPKCKAAVPQQARARRGSVREQLLAGGTSTEPEALGSSSSWLPWVLIALVIVGIGAFLAFRNGGSKSTTTDTGKVTDDEADDEDVDDTDVDEPDDTGTDTPRRKITPVEEPATDTMGDAVVALDEALTGARLWAKVSHDDDTLIIESSLCPQIEEKIGELARPAKALGANRVECHAQHGQVMFEQGL